MKQNAQGWIMAEKKNKKNKESVKAVNFFKVCPNFFSTKLNSHLGLTGEGYKCESCEFDNFYPLEVDEKTIAKLKAKKLKKN